MALACAKGGKWYQLVHQLYSMLRAGCWNHSVCSCLLILHEVSAHLHCLSQQQQSSTPTLTACCHMQAPFLSALAALSPDLCVTAAYGNMLPQAFLDIPKYGTLNIHPSLLPKYRGAAPVPRALQVQKQCHPCPWIHTLHGALNNGHCSRPSTIGCGSVLRPCNCSEQDACSMHPAVCCMLCGVAPAATNKFATHKQHISMCDMQTCSCT